MKHPFIIFQHKQLKDYIDKNVKGAGISAKARSMGLGNNNKPLSEFISKDVKLIQKSHYHTIRDKVLKM